MLEHEGRVVRRDRARGRARHHDGRRRRRACVRVADGLARRACGVAHWRGAHAAQRRARRGAPPLCPSRWPAAAMDAPSAAHRSDPTRKSFAEDARRGGSAHVVVVGDGCAGAGATPRRLGTATPRARASPSSLALLTRAPARPCRRRRPLRRGPRGAGGAVRGLLRQLRRLAEDEIDHGSEGIGNEGSVGEALAGRRSLSAQRGSLTKRRRADIVVCLWAPRTTRLQLGNNKQSRPVFRRGCDMEDLPATLRMWARGCGPCLLSLCVWPCDHHTPPRASRRRIDLCGCGRRRSHKSSSQTRDRFVVASAPPPPPPRHPAAPCAVRAHAHQPTSPWN